MSLRREQGSLSLTDLHLVTALAGAGSLAGAARRLGLNHASAWRRLGAIEARLGARLFDRARTGYAPTPAGEEAIAAADRVLREIDGLERRLAGKDVAAHGTVRLTTTDTLLGLVAPVLAGLRTTHPGVAIDLVTANAFFTLTRRDADVALRPADAAPEGLVGRRLAGVATAVYAAPGMAGRAVEALDWLAPDDGLAHLGSAKWIAAHVAPERIVLRASGLPALQAAARAGMGAAPLPCFLGDADAGLVRMTEPLAAMASSLWLLTHPDLRRTGRVRAVMDALAAGLAVARPLLEGAGPRVQAAQSLQSAPEA